MSNKIRDFRSHIKVSRNKVSRNVEAETIWQLKQKVDILKEKVKILSLELSYKNHELEKIKQSRYLEHELYTIINSMLLNLDDSNELTKNLVACDQVINNVLTELFHAVHLYNSVNEEEFK